MSGPGATPLFIDTGAFFARFADDAARHAQATAVFDAIQAGDLVYQPLYTSTYVLDELATLLRHKSTHERALDSLNRIRTSGPVILIHPTDADFDATCEQFARYDDHEISFTDHMSGVLAADRDVERVFAFDKDFATLGFTRVPVDTGDP